MLSKCVCRVSQTRPRNVHTIDTSDGTSDNDDNYLFRLSSLIAMTPHLKIRI